MSYILTSPRRHRQTPASKHDEKTRHVGLAHVAQPSYLAYSYFGEVFSVARYAVAYVPGSFRDFPAPRIGAARRDASPCHWFRGSGLCSGGPLGERTLPKLRPGGGYSVPPFAAPLRHERPYPPMSKIRSSHPVQVKRRELYEITPPDASSVTTHP